MIKRIIDLLVSSTLLVLLSPIVLILSISVLCLHGRPAIFCQPRAGINGKPFMMYKLRTMTNQLDCNGQLLDDFDRLTRFGRFLRSTSLDELPGLWNVIRGDMSLVGPRPLLLEYIPHYSKTQFRRHEVLPGVTGWAQINGRNKIPWDKKFELDVWYVDNRSILLDIKILAMSLSKVLKRVDVEDEKNITAPKFSRNKEEKNTSGGSSNAL
mgnify:CR=1 FL=1